MITRIIGHFYGSAQAQAIGMAHLRISGNVSIRRSRAALARYNRWNHIRRAWASRKSEKEDPTHDRT